MKHRMVWEISIVLLVILIILPSNSFYFSIPGEKTDSQVIEVENSLINFENLKSAAQFQTESSEQNYVSIRDKNNNKISDYLDSQIENGLEKLDIIVIYSSEITDNDIKSLTDLDVEVVDVFWYFDMVSLNSVPVHLINTILDLPGVERIENHGEPVQYSDVATPAVKARESDLYSPTTAWELGYTGVGANIAVVDTGVDNGHPSLNGKWVAGADISKPETFLTPRDGSYDADDTNGHGTTCTGIAMGTGAPDGVYMGAAPGAKVVDVRIGTMIGYAPGELLQSYYDASLQGIEWVVEHREDSWQGQGEENKGIDILSLSWGIDVGGASDGSDPYSRALDRAVDSGVIVCHAAGNSGPSNDGFDGFAAASNGISVAASDDLNTIDREDDIIAEYSSRGPRHDNGDDNPYNELKPDVTAPGTNIVQAQFDVMGDGSGNGYGNRGSGTSYATPVVAGICAMMLEANPNLTPEITKEILHLTAERRGEPSIPELDPFWNKDFGWGVVDAYKAVKVSASIKNIDIIDVNLQCFIIDIELGLENETSGTVDIQGLAFAKDGEIEQIEISIDDGNWKTVKNIEEDGIYSIWNYKLDTTELTNGNHTIKARAVSSNKQSLEYTTEIETVNEPKLEEGITAGQITLSVVFILILAVAIIVYLYSKKRKKSSN